jgi:hypothetical protein
MPLSPIDPAVSPKTGYRGIAFRRRQLVHGIAPHRQVVLIRPIDELCHSGADRPAARQLSSEAAGSRRIPECFCVLFRTQTRVKPEFSRLRSEAWAERLTRRRPSPTMHASGQEMASNVGKNLLCRRALADEVFREKRQRRLWSVLLVTRTIGERRAVGR